MVTTLAHVVEVSTTTHEAPAAVDAAGCQVGACAPSGSVATTAYSIRYWHRGRLKDEAGPYPVPWTGSGTANDGGCSFGPGTYPRTVGMQGVIDIGGERTSIGGQLITCSGPETVPTIELVETFLPPCGVGDAPAFSDVPASHPFCDDVAWAVDWGITEGFGVGTSRATHRAERPRSARLGWIRGCSWL